MTDVVLIQHGAAHQIWRGTTIENLRTMFAPELVAQMREVSSSSVSDGDVWDGTKFSAPVLPPPRIIVPYVKFRAQWTDSEKAALHAATASKWQIDDFVGLARAQNSVNLSGETAAQAKAAMVEYGILTQDRADIIFNPSTYAG